ncbi:hypothetical protein [Cohnella sp. REN36]|uniref:hypothetical protein n=1 Tax=Cohnella sp. REN36 TaxID=2887347 RepID=UPI001D14F9F8|nr:hypothetical protein [Cohnella sp. REN36]MCC3376109.1 hypothetical protein [Cohnella sp. REN36]
MKIYDYLIRLGLAMFIILGGGSLLHAAKTGDYRIDQLIGGAVGAVLLIGGYLWKRKRAKR